MRLLLPVILTLACVPALAADKEKPLGRSPQQRFNPTMDEQQALVFDTRQGAVGDAHSYGAGKARVKSFPFGKSYSAATYDAGTFKTKKSWLDRFKFGSKSASEGSKSDLAGGGEKFSTKTASTKSAAGSGKTAAVNELPSANRKYAGPESKKIGEAIDPVTLADWRKGGETIVTTGGSVERYQNLKQLSVDDVREILNKNK